MCTCATINKMCYHRLPQKALEDNYCFLLLILLEKNPHACFLNSTFTKRESLEQNITILKVDLTKQNKTNKQNHLNLSCRENWATLCRLNNRD